MGDKEKARIIHTLEWLGLGDLEDNYAYEFDLEVIKV